MLLDTRWPTAVDYQTALQIPEHCFKDRALRKGMVVPDPFGLPHTATGNIVTVFRMRLEDHDVAIRCFTRQSEFEVVSARYKALIEHLQHSSIPALVTCEFRPDEILVGDHRYPVVLMEWVSGVHLHRFIEKHVESEHVMKSLASQWRVLMNRMSTIHVAHGDFSDGNILVDMRHRIRLIDYDGIFVPGLEELPPLEVGKLHYQHPNRLNRSHPEYGYYAENMDAFSALMIYLTLRALADDPSRWQRYHMGENLIFTHADFKEPGNTLIWEDLLSSTDAEIVHLSELLIRYCNDSVEHLPSLEDALQEGLASLITKEDKEVLEALEEDAFGYESSEAGKVEKTSTEASLLDAKEEVTGTSWLGKIWSTDEIRQTLGKEGDSLAPPPSPAMYVPKEAGADDLEMASVDTVEAFDTLVFQDITKRKEQKPQDLAKILTAPWLRWGMLAGMVLAVLGIGYILFLLIVSIFGGNGDGTSPAPVVAVASEDLIGFYTGSAIAQDGTQEAVMLTIDPPVRRPSSVEARMPFSVNWKSSVVRGVGLYNAETGTLQLGEYYEFFVALESGRQVVLVASPEKNNGLNVEVRKRSAQ